MEQTTLKPLDNEGVKTAVIVEQAAAPANEADADLTLCTDDQLPLTDGQKESIKITATYFNNLAVGIAVVGGVTPLLALFFSGSGLMGGDPLKVTVLCGTLIAAVIFSPERGGSVSLNRFRAFSKWFSASVMPLPLRVSAC